MQHGSDDEASYGDDVSDVEPLVEAIADGPYGEYDHGCKETIRSPTPSELGPHEDETPNRLADADIEVELNAPGDEMGSGKEPDDSASPFVEEGKSIEGVSSEEAGGKERKGNLFERHDEDDRYEAHGDVTGTIPRGPPGSIRQGAGGRISCHGGVGALAPLDTPLAQREGSPRHADSVGCLLWPTLGEVKDTNIGTDEIRADERQDDRDGQHEEGEHESAEAGEGEDLALLEWSIRSCEAFAVFVDVIAVDVDAFAELVDSILCCPSFPLCANERSVAYTEHMESAEDETDDDGDKP